MKTKTGPALGYVPKDAPARPAREDVPKDAPARPVSEFFSKGASSRLSTLDFLRGLTLVSMILYHGLWDFLYLSKAGLAVPALRAWYEGTGGHLWQQSICRTFILLSGFCVPLSGHLFRRGLQVSLAGCAVSAATFLFAYEERVLFGVLTFLGMAMLLTCALKKLFLGKSSSLAARAVGRGAGGLHGEAKKCRNAEKCISLEEKNARHPTILYAFGLFLCAFLFHVTRWVNAGFLRIGPLRIQTLPAVLYQDGTAGLFLTALGFPMPGFYSTDYFSLLPWIFLFWAGLFLHLFLTACTDPACRTTDQEAPAGLFSHPLFHLRVPVLNWMGRHSLLIYLLHQPVLYLFIVRS